MPFPAMRSQQAPLAPQPLLNLTLWITTLLLLFQMLWFPPLSPGQFSAHWKSEAVAVVRPLQTAVTADTQQTETSPPPKNKASTSPGCQRLV